MGRYAQRRRAASGPSPAAAPPPSGVTITDVQVIGLGSVLITFSGVVVFTSGIGFDAAFDVDGNAVNNVNSVPSSPSATVNVNVSGSPAPGSTWTLSSQPGWLTTAAATPQTGLCT